GTSYRVRIVLGYLFEPCSDCGPPSRIGVQAELEDFEVFATSNPSLKFRISQPSFPSVPTVSSDNKCPGQAVRLSFAIACKFFSENSFTAQLSNAMGNFEVPVNLGSVKPGTLNNVMIPWGTPAGTGYKIRVVSSNPEVTSAASANFKVKACNNTREAAPEEVGLQVRVSPNPATGGRLKIALGGVEGQKLNVALFNGTGQSVRQQAIERAGEEEILDWDITRQPAGLYLLRVSSGKEAKTVKVLH
ncbi:MAG: T9SS type A sorting domain-containing protein, partial [Sphingobacteriaceae bacterium]|nr:T9SS type A sorting domain-containing protein [Cytophagaceae bacterium]